LTKSFTRNVVKKDGISANNIPNAEKIWRNRSKLRKKATDRPFATSTRYDDK
jgi:hypothetical protein